MVQSIGAFDLERCETSIWNRKESVNGAVRRLGPRPRGKLDVGDDRDGEVCQGRVGQRMHEVVVGAGHHDNVGHDE